MSRTKNRVLAAFIFLFAAFQAGAETITLTIEDAVRRAQDQSINLRKSSIDLAQAEYSAGRLWSEIFPGFSLSAGFTFLPAAPLLTDPGFSYRSDALSYSLSLGVSLSLNMSLKSSMKRIELAYRSQLLSYESASKQLEIQVIKNFLSLITRKANIDLMEENLALAADKLEMDRIRRANGLTDELTWLNSQLSVETARYNLIDAQGAYQNALGEFLTLLGIEAGTDVVFEGTIEIAPVLTSPEEFIVNYLPARPDIMSQKQTIERLELTQDITTLNARTPSLSLSTTWRGNNNTGSPPSGGLSAPFSDSISGSLTLNIPVDSWIPGTRQNQSLMTAANDVEKAKLDLQNIEASAQNQIRQLVSGLNNTLASLEIARLRVSIAERNAELSEAGFRQGMVESRDLEDARQSLSNARQRLLQEEYNYQSLLLDLAAALNTDWRTLTKPTAGGVSRAGHGLSNS